MEEEPTVDRSLQKLMDMLEKEVPLSVAAMGPSDLYKDSVFEAESLLTGPGQTPLKVAIAVARAKTKAALKEWLQAVSDEMHYTSE